MLQIRVSHDTDRELECVVRLLEPLGLQCKISGNREGNHRKAYLKENKHNKPVANV